MQRNGAMLRDFAPDAVLATPGGKGTANMVLRSLSAGVPVYAINDQTTLARLPALPRDHNNKPALPRIDTEKFVQQLIARGTPVTAPQTATPLPPAPRPLRPAPYSPDIDRERD
jgi:hypothetical protein